MPRRVATAVILLVLLAPASALAQGNDLLPPTAAPTSTPVPTPAPTASPSSSTTGTTTLYIIGVVLLLAFIGIGLWIARDARRSLPVARRQRGSSAEPLPVDGAPRPRPPHVKQKARARGKAQRHARRANRPGR
jgi:hypothetical protein